FVNEQPGHGVDLTQQSPRVASKIKTDKQWCSGEDEQVVAAVERAKKHSVVNRRARRIGAKLCHDIALHPCRICRGAEPLVAFPAFRETIGMIERQLARFFGLQEPVEVFSLG